MTSARQRRSLFRVVPVVEVLARRVVARGFPRRERSDRGRCSKGSTSAIETNSTESECSFTTEEFVASSTLERRRADACSCTTLWNDKGHSVVIATSQRDTARPASSTVPSETSHARSSRSRSCSSRRNRGCWRIVTEACAEHRRTNVHDIGDRYSRRRGRRASLAARSAD